MDVRDSSSTMDKFLKSFDYKDSKFKTMCHKDFWTSQIMFQLKQDGEMKINLSTTDPSWFFPGSPSSVKILDYQTLTPGHPAFDIWAIVYSATDAEYRALHLEEDLKAYYEVLSGFMEEQVDFKIFREEVENRRVKGMTMDGKFLYICRLINKCLSTSLTCLFFKHFFYILLISFSPQPCPAYSPSVRPNCQAQWGRWANSWRCFFLLFPYNFLTFPFLHLSHTCFSITFSLGGVQADVGCWGLPEGSPRYQRNEKACHEQHQRISWIEHWLKNSPLMGLVELFYEVQNVSKNWNTAKGTKDQSIEYSNVHDYTFMQLIQLIQTFKILKSD